MSTPIEPSEPTSPVTPNPARKRRWLLIGGGIILVLLIGLGLFGWYWVRSGRVNTYVSDQIVTALKEYGVRAEVGGFEIGRGLKTATLRNVKLYNQQTGQLLATIDRTVVTIQVVQPFALRLSREVRIQEIVTTGLNLYVEFDEQGRSNFFGIKQPPPRAPSRITFDTSTLIASIGQSYVHYKDDQLKLRGQLGELKGQGQPIEGSNPPSVQLTLNSIGGQLSFEGRETAIQGLDLSARASQENATIDRFGLTSDIANLEAKGTISDISALRYQIETKSRIVLDKAAQFFAPELAARGEATFDGQVTGEGANYALSGQLRSDDLSAAGFRLRSAEIQDVKLEPKDGNLNFSSRLVRAANISGSGINANGVAINAINGAVRDGRTEMRAGQVAVQQVKADAGSANNLALRNVSAKFGNGQTEVRGDLSLAGGKVNQATLGQTRGQLIATQSDVTLNNFTAAVMGGSAKGNLALSLRGGTSKVQTQFSALKASELFAAANAGTPPLAGTVSGNANLSWPGLNAARLSGTINADFAGQTTQTLDVIPLTGNITARAENGMINFDRFSLRTNATTIEAIGRLSLTGSSDLRFTLDSTRAEELQTIAYSIPAAQEALNNYEPTLSGNFRFQGSMVGPIASPTISGELNAASVGLQTATLGSVTGNVFYSPQEIRFENGVLTAPNGGVARINYASPTNPNATTGKVDATFERLNIDDLVAAAGIPIQQKLVSGQITGEAHLTGLPGAPQGTVNANLLNGIILGQPAESAGVVVNFDQRTARIERLEAKLPQGSLTANGQMDLQTKDFQVQGRADQIDLAQLSSAAEPGSVTATGIANATFNASGNTNNLDDLKVELNAQATQVTVNGQPTGDLTLTGRTSAGGRIDLDLITNLTGQPQPIRASIELRRPGRPITVDSEFNQFNLKPLLAIFAPAAANAIDAAVTGRLHIAGPLENARGEISMAGLNGGLTLTNVNLLVSGNQINVETPLTIALDNSQLRIERTRFYGQNNGLVLGGLIGLTGNAGYNFLLNGNFNLDSLNGFNSEFIFGGTATIDARITGTGASPQLNGEIRLNDIAFSSLSSPVALAEGNGRVVFAGDRIRLENFTGLANDGTLRASGEALVSGLQPTQWQFNINGEDINIYYQGARIVANAALVLNGTQQSQTLSGRIDVPIGEYATNFNFDELASNSGGGGGFGFGGGIATTGGGSNRLIPPVNLDIRIDAPESFLVRNEQVNTVASAFLNLNGTLTEPDLSGRVTLEGGTIKFRGQQYEITTGVLQMPGGFGNPPLLNLVAEGDISSYHVYIGLEGPITSNDLQITLRAEPQLSRQEILSLIASGSIEGNTLDSDSIVRSGLGTAASLLSEEFISQPLGKEAEKLLGLNRFQIDPVLQPNANPAARLTIGRLIARNLSFTYSTNLASEQDQTAIVEYNLTNRFSAIASYTQGGSSARQGSNDNDFTIEVRGRKRFALGTDRAALASAGSGTGTAAGVPVPVRPPRRELPPALVDLNKPEAIKISEDRMRDLIPVIRDGYSRALTRLGERNLVNYLQEKGYFFAEVSSRCQPANCTGTDLRVLYDVSPGERYNLRDIRITGTEELNKGEVISSLESQSGGLLGGIPLFERLPFIGGTARGITSNDRMRNDRESIRRRLVDLGFRSARVNSRLAITPETNDLTIIYDVEEGPRSIIDNIDLQGNTKLASSDLQEVIPVKTGEPFSQTQIRTGAQQLRNFYAERGYLDARVEPTIEDLENNRVRLTYNVTEGVQAIVKSVELSGNVITKDSSIERFFRFKPGNILTPKLIQQTQRELYATGAFREVNIRNEVVPGGDQSARQVMINVTEAKPLLFVYGLGYSTDEGARALASLTHTNLFGRANTGSIRLRGSKREQLAQLTFTDLRPLGSRWATTFSTFYNRNGNLLTFVRRRTTNNDDSSNTPGRTFGISRFAAFIQSERKFSETTSLRLRYNFERSKLFNLENIPDIEVTRNERAVRLGMVSVGISRDTRDSVLTPTRGQLVSADYSLATRMFGGNETFNKFFANYQRYYTLPEKLPLLHNSTLAFSARIGLSNVFKIVDRDGNGQIDEPERRLPIGERFFAGGATNLRGFRFEEAGPQGVLEPRNANELPTLAPLGGDALAVFNFELRYPLTRRLRLVPFYDLGNVFRNTKDIFRSSCAPRNVDARNLCADWTNTVGMGLRINTPIGPVGVDYGFLLDPPVFTTASGGLIRQPRGVIHIRFGQSF